MIIVDISRCSNGTPLHCTRSLSLSLSLSLFPFLLPYLLSPYPPSSFSSLSFFTFLLLHFPHFPSSLSIVLWLNSDVSLFQRLLSTKRWHLGQMKVSCLPYRRVSFIMMYCCELHSLSSCLSSLLSPLRFIPLFPSLFPLPLSPPSPPPTLSLSLPPSEASSVNYTAGLARYTQMVSSGNFSEISSFMPAIKALLQMAMQLQRVQS